MNLQYIVRELQKDGFFKDFSQQEITFLFTNSTYRNFRNHQKLFDCYDLACQFAVVTQGAFKLVRSTEHGEDTILYFATHGDIIGALFMAQPQTHYNISAIALGPSSALVIPKETFSQFWAPIPKVQMKLNALIYQRMQELHHQQIQLKRSLQGKIAWLLLSLLKRQKEGTKNQISIPLTRQEIADAVGASVESVIRNMKEMSLAGIIDTEEKIIKILKMDRLLELSQMP